MIITVRYSGIAPSMKEAPAGAYPRLVGVDHYSRSQHRNHPSALDLYRRDMSSFGDEVQDALAKRREEAAAAEAARIGRRNAAAIHAQAIAAEVKALTDYLRSQRPPTRKNITRQRDFFRKYTPPGWTIKWNEFLLETGDLYDISERRTINLADHMRDRLQDNGAYLFGFSFDVSPDEPWNLKVAYRNVSLEEVYELPLKDALVRVATDVLSSA